MSTMGPCTDMSTKDPCMDMSAMGPCTDMSTKGPCMGMSTKGPCMNMSAMGPKETTKNFFHYQLRTCWEEMLNTALYYKFKPINYKKLVHQVSPTRHAAYLPYFQDSI